MSQRNPEAQSESLWHESEAQVPAGPASGSLAMHWKPRGQSAPAEQSRA
jgi:hypothetical protein